MKRRSVLKWLVLGTAGFSGCFGPSRRVRGEQLTGRNRRSAREATIIILHTNDLHGHLTEWQGVEGSLSGKTLGGVACLASAIKRERSKGVAVLLLDAG